MRSGLLELSLCALFLWMFVFFRVERRKKREEEEDFSPPPPSPLTTFTHRTTSCGRDNEAFWADYWQS